MIDDDKYWETRWEYGEPIRVPLLKLENEKSLSSKSDQQLIAILENPAEWMPSVLELTHLELARRSISPEQIAEGISTIAKQKAEEFQQRSTKPMTVWETFLAAFYGGILGLVIGLIFVNSQASEFKKTGYFLKHRRAWRVFWLAITLKFALFGILMLIAFASH
jgi:hypothetical protein